MVLESLRADAPVNIKNLVIESPRKPELELPFDPKRDITEDDLKAMDERAKADFENESVFLRWNAADICASLKLLFPKRPLPVDFNSDENFRPFREDFHGHRVQDAKILYPKKTISDYGKSARDYMDNQLQQATKDVNKDLYIFPALRDLKLFYPEATQQLLAGKEAAKNSSHQQIGSGRPWRAFLILAETAASAKIALEGDFDVEIPKEYWQDMREELGNFRTKGLWEDFAIMARDMYILAAEKVRVTPNEGLVLTMPAEPKPDFYQHIPPLPQMRRF